MERIVKDNILRVYLTDPICRLDDAGIAEPKAALDPYYVMSSALNTGTAVYNVYSFE